MTKSKWDLPLWNSPKDRNSHKTLELSTDKDKAKNKQEEKGGHKDGELFWSLYDTRAQKDSRDYLDKLSNSLEAHLTFVSVLPEMSLRCCSLTHNCIP